MSQLRSSAESFYLTLTSMIQSLAFGFLLTSLDLSAPWTFTYTIQVITTLLLIVTVWHEYAMGAIVVNWLLDFSDSVIPFLFGLVQFALITALSRKGGGLVWWFTSLFGFAIISLLALLNQYTKLSKDASMKPTLELLRSREWMAYVVFSAFSFLIEAMIIHATFPRAWVSAALAAASLITAAAFASRGVLLYPKVMLQLEDAKR